MNKVSYPSLCAFVLLCAASSLAQSGAYRFDNFDTRQGVQIIEEPRPVPAPAKLKGARAKTAKPIGAARPVPLSYSPALASRALTAAALTKQSLDGFSTGDAKVDAFILESGMRNRVDPVLIYAVMHQESAFRPHAISPKGARGLMQLMPMTAARFGVRNIFDPRENIEGGARYMRFLLDMFDGDVHLALAGYNAGEGAVMKYGRAIPPYRETQEYVRRIGYRYALMRDPQTARMARFVTPAQAAAIKEEPPVPITMYEQSVFAVRMPDGKLRLVSQ